jgi:ABC-type dipeptide/oligopeptide/nickel transport systems, permease components
VRYLLGKLGLFVLTLWAAVTVNFILPRLMPGSPADAAIAKLSQNGPVSPAMRASIEAQLGVPTGSLWDQYVTYLGQIVHFDFGPSFSYFPQSVSSLIGAALPWTLVLVGTVTILAFVLGTLLGVLAAWKRGTALDTHPDRRRGSSSPRSRTSGSRCCCCSSSATWPVGSPQAARTRRRRRRTGAGTSSWMRSTTASCPA